MLPHHLPQMPTWSLALGLYEYLSFFISFFLSFFLSLFLSFFLSLFLSFFCFLSFFLVRRASWSAMRYTLQGPAETIPAVLQIFSLALHIAYRCQLASGEVESTVELQLPSIFGICPSISATTSPFLV